MNILKKNSELVNFYSTNGLMKESLIIWLWTLWICLGFIN